MRRFWLTPLLLTAIAAAVAACQGPISDPPQAGLGSGGPISDWPPPRPVGGVGDESTQSPRHDGENGSEGSTPEPTTPAGGADTGDSLDAGAAESPPRDPPGAFPVDSDGAPDSATQNDAATPDVNDAGVEASVSPN